MGGVVEAMEAKLRRAFAPTQLSLVDDSARHAGHAGARPGGQSHFTLEIESPAFARLSRLQRHRLIHGTLAEELAGDVHALAIRASAPGEPA